MLILPTGTDALLSYFFICCKQMPTTTWLTIQALLDERPNASRRELGPQIHAISGDTHREIHALLSDHQKELEKAMQHREHEREENRRPAT